jgi:PAS domain S-box-containing protein
MSAREVANSSVELYKEVSSNVSMGVLLYSSEGEILWLNKALLTLLGTEDEKKINTHYRRKIENLFLSSDFLTKFATSVGHPETPYLHRSTLITIKSAHRPVSVNLEKVRDSSNKYFAAFISLIQPGSLDSLEGIGIQLRSYYEKMNDFYYVRNFDGTIISANQTFLDFFTTRDLKALSSKTLRKQSPNNISALLGADINFMETVSKMKFADQLMYTQTSLLDNLVIRRIVVPDPGGLANQVIVSGNEFFDFSAAQKSIIDTQTNLFTLIESSESCIWLIDKNFKIILLNSQFKKLIYTLYEKNIQEKDDAVTLFPKSYAEVWNRVYKTALKGESSQGEIQINEDNLTSYFEFRVKPVFNYDYCVENISVFLTDITYRKAAEEAVKESEERFRQLAENTYDVLILKENDRIIYVNPAFEKLFGTETKVAYSTPDIIEKSLSEQDRKKLAKARNNLTSKNIVDSGNKYSIITNAGTTIQVWIRTGLIYDNLKRFQRELLIISDLTGQAELENTVSQTRLRQKAILDNIPYLAWLKDNEGRYISVNEPFTSFLNLKLEDIIGKVDEDIFDEDTSKILNKYDSAVRIARKRKYFEDEWVVKGNPCWIETFASPIFGDTDKLIGITGIARDITDRKTMEDTIIRNEEHFRALLQYSSDAITILDKSGTIMFESALRNRISDFLIDEIIGKAFEDIIHPDDVHIFKDVLNILIQNPGVQLKREYRCLHKNKRWIYVESIFSNHIKNPSIRGIVVNSRDISDRKMSELKERVYHDNLVFLSNSALELLGLSVKEDIFKYIGKKLFGYLENSIIAVSGYQENNSFKIESITASDENIKQIDAIYGEDIVGQKYEIKDLTKSITNAGNINNFKGSVDDLGLNSHLLGKLKKIKKSLKVSKFYYISMSRDNKLLGNILILTLNNTIIKYKHIIETFVHQVSVALQRSQLESELIKAKEKAEESDKLKTAFLANMSHEIRTPMNGILGFAEMLNDDHLGEGNRKKYVEIINNNGKMLMNLIDDVIDFAKIEAGEIKILQQDFSLNVLLSQIHASFLSESLKKERDNLKLRIRKAFSNEDCYIQSDPNRLRQVLTNLVGNAFKFTKEGFIEFGYESPKNGFIEFFVKDTGIGIPQEKLEVIFERFVQADYSRSRKYGGSGLGLAISKGFVELLGGKMWATSRENDGSVFYFTIPYKQATRKTREEIETKKPRTDYNWEGKLFLIAEDDTFSFKLLEGFLKKTNASILHANDGVQAVDICKNNPEIDLVLMDVQMPEMNGMEATRLIKEIRRELPVIAQTANAIAEERQKCFEAGCDDFVTKPINIAELFLKIDQWLSPK